MANVREIIFTPEFMDKLINYLYEDKPFMMKERLALHDDIMSNLDNPVQYLNNLIN